MRIFSPIHISLLAATATVAIVLAVLCRRDLLPARAVRLTLGWGLALNEILRPFAVEFAYLVGILSIGLTLLTPTSILLAHIRGDLCADGPDAVLAPVFARRSPHASVKQT